MLERLGHRDEGGVPPIEDLDQPGEVLQAPGEPIDLVDHHDVDVAGLDFSKEPLQRWAFQGGARDAAIVEPGRFLLVEGSAPRPAQPPEMGSNEELTLQPIG